MEALASLTTRHAVWPSNDAAPLFGAILFLLLLAMIAYRLRVGRLVTRLLSACGSRLSASAQRKRDRNARRRQLEREVLALQDELSRLESAMANPHLQPHDNRFAEIRASLERMERQVQQPYR